MYCLLLVVQELLITFEEFVNILSPFPCFTSYLALDTIVVLYIKQFDNFFPCFVKRIKIIYCTFLLF